MTYYAKSLLPNGSRPTVKEHLEKVSVLASKFGETMSMEDEARLAGLFHDFGKYSDQFQMVLSRDMDHVDHALPGAVFLSKCWQKYPGLKKWGRHIVEAIAGHHDGLRNSLFITPENPAQGKTSSILTNEKYLDAQRAFLQDFPGFRMTKLKDPQLPAGDKVASMLYTRMLFSCLVDADYSVSASDLNEGYVEQTTNDDFDPYELLCRLSAYRDKIRKQSRADSLLNLIRDTFFEQCGKAGEENTEGLFTLTGPTGIGKTLALIHFSLRHCISQKKRRIIIVLPFLSLTEQTVKEYGNIVDYILEDTSQIQWSDETKEYTARWSTPVIVTTSVKFFETLFSDQPTDCRKLHHIANSVIVFDEAQSLPNEVLACTLQAVNELCRRYHVTMVFSTATQPDYHAISDQWQPKELYPDNRELFQKLKRVNVTWRIEEGTPFLRIAQEMAKKTSACAIVNLRRHAITLYESLTSLCPEEQCFFLTTDLCAAHRSERIRTIKERLKAGLPCRVVATQCIEAGVDLDFDVMYRALAPLESIIQAAGRCNRNGRLLQGGEVIVFVPDEEGRLYPGNWYMQGANVVAQMIAEKGTINIHDPATVQAYYQLLFLRQRDKQELTEAIEERDYERTRKEYRLIADRGVQIIVPYGELEQRYVQLKECLMKEGLKQAQMRELAPYSVTCLAPREIIETFAEPVPLPARIQKNRKIESGYYVLCPQWLKAYTLQTGLRLVNENANQYFL